MKLKDIGERGIIDLISNETVRDDCAVVKMGNTYLLASTDLITRKTHIPEGTDPELVGKFFASINLSDIAAMAGIPLGILVSLSISPEYDISFLKSFYKGMTAQLKKYNAEIIGGDTKEGNDFTVSGTILGRQKYRLIRKRSDIGYNQYLMVTNYMGKSGAGYIFYKYGNDKQYGIKKMMDIEPRIYEAQIISKLGARFMMDLSDGIYSSIHQMKNDYDIGFKIYLNRILMDKDVEKASSISGFSVADIALGWGGDYELLFTIDKNVYEQFMSRIKKYGINAYIIGETYSGKNIIFDKSMNEISNTGFEHFNKEPL